MAFEEACERAFDASVAPRLALPDYDRSVALLPKRPDSVSIAGAISLELGLPEGAIGLRRRSA